MSEYIKRLNKLQRQELIKLVNLNCIKWDLIDGKGDIKKLKCFYDEHRAACIRTYREDNPHEKSTPFYPIIKNYPALLSTVLNIIDMGYKIILCEPIELSEVKFAGCILRDESIWIIEIARGPVTVRNVTNLGLIDERHISFGRWPKINDGDIRKVILEIYNVEKTHEETLDKALYEFSFFHNRHGYQNKNYVFWEIAPLPMHYEEWASRMFIEI